MKIVSACLAGVKCNFEGKSKPCQKVIELVKKGKAIPVCPEQLGGLPTPRIPSEIRDDRVVTKEGDDVTSFFQKGGEEAFRIASLVKCTEAIMKARSPSCGSGYVYDGTFSGMLREGDGIFTTKLKKKNIKVFTEEEI